MTFSKQKSFLTNLPYRGGKGTLIHCLTERPVGRIEETAGLIGGPCLSR